MELFKILGTIAIDAAEALKALRDAQQEGEKTESKLSKVFSGIGKGAAVAGKAIASGLAVGATAMAGLTMKALSASGELEQNLGGAEAVFGDLGNSIEKMSTTVITGYDEATGKAITATRSLEQESKDAYKNMGLSQSDYLATANKMGALFKGAGFETQEALDLSSQAMQRAADVASIMGIDTSAAMEAVAGAAKGNFTMMDNLGVAMNDTAIAAYAQSKGINKATSEMSQQEKIGLAMEMFLEKTSYATGNYAKENETLAGSLSTAKAAFTNFLAGSGDVDSLVSSFSNLANVVVNSLTEIAPRLTQGLSDLVQQVVPLIPPLLNTLLPVLVEGATTLINGLVAALPAVISALIGVLPQLVQAVTAIVDGIAAALPQMVSALVSQLWVILPDIIMALVEMIGSLCSSLPQIIQPIIDALPGILVNIVRGLTASLPALIEGLITLTLGIVTALPQIIQALVDAIPTVVSLLVEAILTNLPALIVGLVQVTMGIVAALPQIFGSLNQAIPAVLSGIWDGIKDAFAPVGEWFGEKFSAAKECALNAWSDAKEKWNGVKEKVSGAWNDLKTKVGTKFSEAKKTAEEKWNDAKTKWNGIKEKVVSGFSDLKTKVGNKFSEAKESAEQKWSDAKEKFGSVKDKVVSAFSDLGSKLSPLFSKAKDNATKTWSNVKSIFNKFKTGDIVGAFSDLGSLLKGKFSSALDAAKQGFNKIKQIGKDLITGLWNGINDKFSWLTGKIKGFANGVMDKIKSFFGIHSPSVVMRDEVGKMLAEGVAVGIEEASSSAEDAADGMAKNVIEAATERLDEYKRYNELTIADEVAFWAEIRDLTEDGTDDRLEADKKYLAAKASMDEQLIAAEQKLKEALKETQEELADSFGLFGDVEFDDWMFGSEMIDKLSDQTLALEKYEAELKKLKDKIGDGALYKELAEMGVKALPNITSINSMSDAQLEEFVGQYAKRAEVAGRLAAETAGNEYKATLSSMGIELEGIDGIAVEELAKSVSYSISSVFDTIVATIEAEIAEFDESVSEAVKETKTNGKLADKTAYEIATEEGIGGLISTLSSDAEELSEIFRAARLNEGDENSKIRFQEYYSPDGEYWGRSVYVEKDGKVMINKEEDADGNLLHDFSAVRIHDDEYEEPRIDDATNSDVVDAIETTSAALDSKIELLNPTGYSYNVSLSEKDTTNVNKVSEQLEAMSGMISGFLSQILANASKAIQLDTGELVGALASPMDAALGKLSIGKDRGL